MRAAANAFAAVAAAASCAYGTAWFVTGALSPDGGGCDVLGAGVCTVAFVWAGALAFPRKSKEPTA
jgi:hypothetical protein